DHRRAVRARRAGAGATVIAVCPMALDVAVLRARSRHLRARRPRSARRAPLPPRARYAVVFEDLPNRGAARLLARRALEPGAVGGVHRRCAARARDPGRLRAESASPLLPGWEGRLILVPHDLPFASESVGGSGRWHSSWSWMTAKICRKP